MKNIFSIFFSIIISYSYSQTAPPQAFSYSAVARDGQGNPLVNQNIGIQFSILKGSTVGPIQFQENHFTPTNQFGLFNLTLGTGAVQQGVFNSINWSNDSYYLKVGLDANGGTNFQVMGTTQFLSVPYALYAGSAGNQSYQILSLSNDTLHLSNGGNVYLGSYRDSITHQTLSLNNDTLKISQGNQVVLPYNSTPSITVKINGVDITDPSINDAMIGPYTFLTENNYRYDFFPDDDEVGEFGAFSDTLQLSTPHTYINNFSSSFGANSYIFFTGGTCNGSIYVPASAMTNGFPYSAPFSRGRIFHWQGSVYYIPLNAPVTSLTNPYTYDQAQGGCVGPITGTFSFYMALPNNPAVTGFGFTSPKLKVTFSR